MKRFILSLLPAFSLSASAEFYQMKASGHEPVTLYKWIPEFSRAEHCIRTTFLFHKVFDDVRDEMNEAGFDTSASYEAGRWNFKDNILRIAPDNVEYVECIGEQNGKTYYHYNHMELCQMLN